MILKKNNSIICQKSSSIIGFADCARGSPKILAGGLVLTVDQQGDIWDLANKLGVIYLQNIVLARRRFLDDSFP